MKNGKAIEVCSATLKPGWLGVSVVDHCRICHNEAGGRKQEVSKKDQFEVNIGSYCGDKEDVRITLCRQCLMKLHEEIGRALHKSVREGDTVYELTYCNDDAWHVFPMVVKSVCEFGSVRHVKGKEPMVWNIYAESDSTYMYANFYEEGKKWFVDEADAMEALKEKEKE